jgi:hypothetical protein
VFYDITFFLGIMSGVIKKSLLEGETEETFRARLKQEREVSFFLVTCKCFFYVNR